MLRRIYMVYAARENGYGAAREASNVGFTINPARKPGDDDKSRIGEVRGNITSELSSRC